MCGDLGERRAARRAPRALGGGAQTRRGRARDRADAARANSSASSATSVLLGGQDLVLELGELGRDVALAVRDRLLADVVGGHLREVRLR